MSRLLGLVLVLCLATTASAVDWLNTNANNQWEDDANWSGGAQPTLTDNAIIQLDGANRAILSQVGEQAQDLLVGTGAIAGELQMTGGDLTARKFLVGDGATGIFTQSAGSVVLSEDLLIGNSSGTGTWNMSGGSVFARKVLAGLSNGSTTGTINQSDGTVTTFENYMTGDNGIGKLFLSGGSIHAGVADERAVILGLGGTNGSSETVVKGTGEIFGSDVIVGDNARGSNTLIVDENGKVNAGRSGGAMRIAANNAVTGHVTVQGSGEINIGPNPLANVRGPLVVGVNPSSTSVDDATLLVKDIGIVRASRIVIADAPNSDGKIELQGGTIDASEVFIVGSTGKTGTIAELEVSGGLLKSPLMLLTDGADQTAIATLTGGLVQLTGNIGIGANANLGSALLTIDAPGTVLTANNLVLFNNGDVVHRMGDVVLQGTINIQPDGGFGRGTYDLQMGTVSLGGDRTVGMQNLINSGLIFSSNPLVTGFSLVFDGSQTTLSVVKIPEPATFTLFVIAAISLWGVRRRAIGANFC